MVIFHSYLSLPEGNKELNLPFDGKTCQGKASRDDIRIISPENTLIGRKNLCHGGHERFSCMTRSLQSTDLFDI
jgi:hypothetical protein